MGLSVFYKYTAAHRAIFRVWEITPNGHFAERMHRGLSAKAYESYEYALLAG
jgi:hypothetical protein